MQSLQTDDWIDLEQVLVDSITPSLVDGLALDDHMVSLVSPIEVEQGIDQNITHHLAKTK